MPEGLVPRMAIEWGFLILLAVGAAIADLRPIEIILVMAVGWVLVVLVELLAWRARPGYAVTEEVVEEAPRERIPAGELPPLQPPIPPAYDLDLRPPAEPLPSTTEDTAVGEPFRAEAEGERATLDPNDPYAPAPERDQLRQGDQRVVHRLEPLKPRPRRGLFRRGRS